MNYSQNAEKYYSQNLIIYEKISTKLKKKLIQVSLTRLLAMILTVFFLVKSVNTGGYYLSFSVLSLIAFVILVKYHNTLSNKKLKTDILSEMNSAELSALKGDFSMFTNGSNFLDPDHEFTYDLDIFGDKSLYQFICRCCTIDGEIELAQNLTKSPLTEKAIYEKQNIIRELSHKPEFIQDYLATGKMIKENPGESEQIINWLHHKPALFSRGIHIVSIILSLINLSILILSPFISGMINYLIISALLSWAFYGFFFTKINRYHTEIGKKQIIIKKYAKLSSVLASGNFENEHLNKYKDLAKKSIKNITKLEKLMNLFDSRLNIFMGLIMNTLFLSDFHVIFSLEKWKKENASLLEQIKKTLSRTDAIISGGIFAFNHQNYTYPVPGNENFSAVQMGHPLLNQKDCVLNDFQQNNQNHIYIITGANMAGKSTFLRTLGVNLILAGAGFPVYAKKFLFKPIPVITGMRTTDSLAESESYFFAELKRLQRIIIKLRKGENFYILLDEILKGTNSTDKHQGSVALLSQIQKYKAVLFIATHDLHLGNLEKNHPKTIKNFHFDSTIINDELSFDYKIKGGIAQNMNASFLLKKMNITTG